MNHEDRYDYADYESEPYSSPEFDGASYDHWKSTNLSDAREVQSQRTDCNRGGDHSRCGSSNCDCSCHPSNGDTWNGHVWTVNEERIEEIFKATEPLNPRAA